MISMRAPMVRLARPDLGDAGLDAMGCAELRALAKDLRVFSDRPGGEEFPLYARDDGAVVYGGGGGVDGGDGGVSVVPEDACAAAWRAALRARAETAQAEANNARIRELERQLAAERAANAARTNTPRTGAQGDKPPCGDCGKVHKPPCLGKMLANGECTEAQAKAKLPRTLPGWLQERLLNGVAFIRTLRCI